MHAKKKAQFLAATLVAPGLFIAGCSGGGSNNPFNPTPTTAPGTATPTATSGALAANLVGLSSDGRLFTFNSQTPNSTSALTLSGITSGQLLGIDFRFAPDAAGTQGLYGLGGSNGNFQLYRIAISGTTATATAVGSPIAVNLGTDIGFDFNPNVPSPADATVRLDRIRVVGSNRVNLRLVPNTGAVVDGDANTPGTQFDGTIAFAAGDSNAGATPRLVGAAYNNNDTDIATGTINYAIDIATGSLVTQGRPAGAGGTPAAVSPNTGQLFTVGRLGVSLVNNLGFDIAPGTNNAVLTTNNRLYNVNLGTGAATLAGSIAVPSGVSLRGLAFLS